jgi:hypothetical protein
MLSDDTAVIIVVVLQDSLDLPDGELGSSSRTGVTSDEGSEVLGFEAESVPHVSEIADEPTIPEIQTENSVSSVSVVIVTHVLYSVYLALQLKSTDILELKVDR